MLLTSVIFLAGRRKYAWQQYDKSVRKINSSATITAMKPRSHSSSSSSGGSSRKKTFYCRCPTTSFPPPSKKKFNFQPKKKNFRGIQKMKFREPAFLFLEKNSSSVIFSVFAKFLRESYFWQNWGWISWWGTCLVKFLRFSFAAWGQWRKFLRICKLFQISTF